MEKIERPELLVLIRHGQSLRNQILEQNPGSTFFISEEERRPVDGVADNHIPLTELGWKQARETGLVLREKFGAPDYFYNSGYLRTVETMKGILEAYSQEDLKQIAIRENIFIRERDSGHTYSMTKEEVEKNFPWLQHYWKLFGHIFARPPGGESLADVADRLSSHFLDVIFRKRGGQKVFVVSHGRAIGCLRFLLEYWSYDYFLEWLFSKDLARKNCGVTVYKRNPETGKLVLDHSGVYWD